MIPLFDRRLFLSRGATTALALTAGCLEACRKEGRGIPQSEFFATRPEETIFLLEHSTVADMWRVRRKVNPIVKSGRNPLIVKDREWESYGPQIHGTVLYDALDKLFKCWYVIFDSEAFWEHRPGSTRACYAISEDGYSGKKPELSLVEWKGSRRNNFVRLGQEYVSGIDVQLVPSGSGVSGRFVACYLYKSGDSY